MPRYVGHPRSTQRATESRSLDAAMDIDTGDTGQRFIDNVAHEFRTPLAVVKKYASLLGDGLLGELNEEQVEFVSIIGDRADDLNNLVDDLTDSARADVGDMWHHRRETSITEIMERVGDRLYRKASVRQIELTHDFSATLPAIFCDPEKAARVLLNLVINGIKYTDEGGQIRLWARHDDRDVVQICVSDTGRGFGEVDATNIADRLSNATVHSNERTKGFGLGLNLATAFVDMWYGEMKFQSLPCEGSTFAFTVPVADSASIARCYLARMSRVHGASCPISLIDVQTEQEVTPEDSHSLRLLLESVLTTWELVCQRGPFGWLVLLPSNDIASTSLEERLSAVVEEANASRNEGRLPLSAVRLERECLCSDSEVVGYALQPADNRRDRPVVR